MILFAFPNLALSTNIKIYFDTFLEDVMSKKHLIIVTVMFIFVALNLKAKTLRASLAHMPIHAVSNSEGIQVELVKAISDASGYKIEIDVFPFARSMDNVIKNRADFHIPLIKNDVIPVENLPYAYSTNTIFQVNFVLYTRKDSDVNNENLANYIVESDRAHINYFPFKTIPSDSIKQSLKRLHLGMTDAYIFADSSTDPLLKQLGYNNIKRSLYKVFDVKIIIPKGDKGKLIDSILINAIDKLEDNGQLQAIEGSVNLPYNNWQTYEGTTQ